MKSYITGNSRGLTLVELIMVVAIVAILGAISIVSYSSYMVRARLQDAKVALETVRAEQEQFRAEFGRYTTPNSLNFFGGQNAISLATALPWGDGNDYGVYFLGAPTTANYTLRADPLTARQQKTKYGGWISIDQNGTRDSDNDPGRWP